MHRDKILNISMNIFHNNFCHQVPASRTRARMCSVRRTRSAFPPLTERVPGKNIIIIVIISISISVTITIIIITIAIITMISVISSSRLTVSASCPIGVGLDRRPAVVSSILIAFILILISFMKITLCIGCNHTCKKRGIAGIYPRNFFWIFRKILG